MSGGVPAGERLKPCPFCGGEAVLRGQDAPEYWVACPAIGCEANTESFSSRNAAIAVWNARTTPAGWVLVPVEPTEAMRNAGTGNNAAIMHNYDDNLWREVTGAIWSAMLAATPTPPIEGRDADVERAIASVLEVYDRTAAHESQAGMFRIADIRVLLAALQALGERG